MRDYDFGEKISRLRMGLGLSQSQLAAKLGVSNKAVSKWETGQAKPRLDTLRQLSVLFGVSVDEFLCEKKNEKSITKIVLTGGPCAGKTTALSRIQEFFSNIGYHVLIVPETATELISGGVTPWGLTSNLDYQICQMKLQIKKEEIFEEAAEKIFAKEKVLIICDRGTADNLAYMTDAEFVEILAAFHTSLTGLRDRYDAVFHMTTAAKGAAEFYTLANNQARTETLDEAVALDDRLIAAWTGHPHFRVIDNSTSFEDKISRTIAEITSFLGEPEPYEIERKFLIAYPNLKKLEENPNCHKIDIIQTYLKSAEDEEIRVRQRGEGGHYVYFKTIKRKVTDIKRVETECRIKKDEYLALLMQADTQKHQIRKTRYCLTYENQYFEIDVYPFWQDQAIMEIELRNENEEIRFPDMIRVIKEVTDDPAYKNAALAARNH